MEAYFEPDLTGTPIEGLFHGHFESVKVTDPEGRTPRRVISMGDTWRVEVKWSFHGMMIQSGMLSGKWNVLLFLESYGPAAEIKVAQATVDIATGGIASPLGRDYTLTFDINGKPTEAGLYRLAVVITSESHTTIPGPFAGFAHSDLLQFHAGDALPQ